MLPPDTSRRTGALAVLALGAVVFWTNLGGYPLWNPDEGRHSEVARELLNARDWRGRVVPSFNGQPYHDKPILYYTAVGAAYAIGGVGEASARAVSATAAIIVLLAVYAAATTAWGVAAGVAAAGVLATAVEFAGLARYGSLDMLLTCWITLGTLAAWRWTERPERWRWLVGSAVALALGTLTKGLVAPVLAAGAILVMLALRRRLGMLRDARPLALAALVYVAVALPWHVAAWHVDPQYVRDFFLRHQLERFAAGRRHFHPKPLWFPAAVTLAGFLPWTALLPAAAARRRADAGPTSSLATLAAAWTAVVVAFFTVSSGKLGTYVLPAFPPLALLVGAYADRLARDGVRDVLERRLLLAGGGLVAAVCLAAWPLLALGVARRDAGAWHGLPSLAAVGVPLAVALLVVMRRRLAWVPAAIGAAMVAIVLLFYLAAAPRVSAVVSDAPLAATIACHGPDAPVVVYAAQTPSLVFYLRRPVRRVQSADGLDRARERRALVFAVTSPRHAHVVESRGYWRWQTTGKHLLYASQPPPQAAAGASACAHM